MKEGILFYDGGPGRFDIRFEDGEIYGGLHSGTAIEIQEDFEWKQTRIEYSLEQGHWRIVGRAGSLFDGMKVRI